VGAVGEAATRSVIVSCAPSARAPVLVHVAFDAEQDHPEPALIESGVTPEGRSTATVTAPAVGANPTLATSIV